MDGTTYFGVGVLVIVLGFFAYLLIRYRGFRGAMFRGRIEKTYGEIRIRIGVGTGATIRVHLVSTATGRRVAIEHAHSTLVGYDMVPFTMDKDEAEALIGILQQAASEA